VNGNRRKWTPSMVKTKLNTIHYVSGELLKGQNSSSADQRGPTHKDQHISFLLVFSSFISFVSRHHSKNGQAEFDDLYVKRRGLTQGNAIWGSQCLQKLSRSSYSPIPPKSGLRIGISGSAKSMNNFSTIYAIFAQN
jgi:hypothetical protein